MSRALLALVALAPLLSPRDARAQPFDGPAGSRAYVFASAGATIAAHHDATALRFDAGPAFEAGVGYRLTRFLAVEGASGYSRVRSHASQQVRTASDPGAPVDTLETDRELLAVPVLASLRLSAEWRRIEVFGVLGLGAHFTFYQATWRWPSSGRATSANDTDTALGVHAGAGVSALVAPGTSVGVQARYVAVQATYVPDVAGSISPPTLVLPPPPAWTPRLDSVIVSASVSRRF